MKRLRLALVSMLATATAACVGVRESGPELSAPVPADADASAAALLRPYYARLARQTDLPSVPGTSLDTAAPLTRLAVGSCNHQHRSQDIWARIAAAGPQAFLAIGDNVYGDHGYRGEADLASFVEAYRLQASHPEFRAFRAAVPVLATWDDHDFGPNDSGGSFFGREWSERLFETFWGSPAGVRGRPGVYQSVTIGPEGQRAQIIMLDTRFFRGELTELPYSEERRALGNYAPDTATGAEMLGKAQWRWLEGALAEPAELRIVVSSIQVLTDAHDFESWENLPRERERLMRSLAAREDSGLVLLSGDRHSGAIYAEEPAALGERVHELTASSLNLAFVSDDASEREPDAKRLTGMVTQENFGLVDIDWNARTLVLRLMDDRGAEIVSRRVTF